MSYPPYFRAWLADDESIRQRISFSGKTLIPAMSWRGHNNFSYHCSRHIIKETHRLVKQLLPKKVTIFLLVL